ncbi:MAG TPA: AAA family ATPase [Thermaerobacter sp.]
MSGDALARNPVDAVERGGREVATGAGQRAGPVGRVRWHRLVLRGFGPYRGEARVDFPDGLVTLVAPNESGKSTLVAGLAAVIYGLPGSSDPTRFGQARFRHWLGAARFEGELEFTAVDGHVYHLYRDFETHRVRLTRLTGGGPVVEVEGVHNPGASRRNSRYEERIQQLVRIGTRELLLQTFCVQQPLLPPATGPGREGDRPALAAGIQDLLAGSGGGSYSGALARLEELLKERTRATGDLGVTTRNQRAERELERLERHIRELEEAIARDREAADGLQRVRSRRAELAGERLELETTLQARERLARAWQDWRRLAERYRDHVGRRVQMEQALERARELARQVEDGRRRLVAEWPELAGAGDETATELERLASLEELLTRDAGQREALAREWRESVARGALAAWQRYRLLSRRLAELESRLAGYDLFAKADESLRERLRNLEFEQARLDQEVEAAAREVERREEERRELEEAERRLATDFGDVSGLSPEALAAIERKPGLLARRQELKEAARRAAEEMGRRRSTALRVALALGVLAGLAGAGAGKGLGMEGMALAVLALLLAAGAGWAAWRLLVTPGAGDGAAGRELQAVEEALRGLDAVLGELAAVPPDDLRRLRERHRTWELQRQALEERRRRLPPPEETAAWRRRLEEALRRREEFAASVEPFRRRYADPAAALRQWEELSEERRRLAAALEQLCRAEWGAAPAEVPSLPALSAGGDWSALARWLGEGKGSGEDGPGGSLTVADVAGRLQGFDPALWERPEAEAAAWQARLEPLAGHPDRLERELERLVIDQRGRAALAEERLRRLDGELQDREREVASLRERLRPVLAAAGGDVARARARWEEYRRHRQRLRELESELAGLLAVWEAADVAALAARVERARDESLLARQELQRLAEAHAGLPGPEAVDDPAAIDERMRDLNRELEELRQRLRELEETERGLMDQEMEYARHDPINIAAAEEELAGLRRRREELLEEIEALALAHRELRGAAEEYHATYRLRLEQVASRHFARITGRPGRRVCLDEDFRVSVVEPDGTRVLPGQLSQGAQDQLYVAVRVAIGDLLADDARLPFVFDDPFVHCDAERLERIRSTLRELAAERQVLVLSHRPELAAWGQPAEVARDG